MIINRVLIIIPCFNEQDSIKGVLHEIIKLEEGYDILVIDDGSTDQTFEISSKIAPTIKLYKNLGIGGCVQTGIIYAYKYNYDFCIQIDGDGQHIPSEINKLISAYNKNRTNMVIGSRYVLGFNKHYKSSSPRLLGGKIIMWVLKLLYNGKVFSDPTSGMRLLDRDCIELFHKNYPFDYPEPISIATALNMDLSIQDCPVLMRNRVSGSSSIRGLKPIAYMLRVIGYIFLARIYK